ncbi:sigma-54 dependent transcriptional regulator [Actimicrobium sp. CCI2.3]|uniref:sigma-54-dependent transcriptional regulator n=1 Tax=Actimicrobium sp. CCI2.3 TaxID=3048616 RepID=UPI002AB56EFC|nr:sigma-54 dependent transcriptional regulator [Actimicrobium sp. CCI2.3]MDY7573587.1 sigma-54 dependent transcriptional regulator [Actimicrobium sp. CCI2.3]MEB0022101.1 sigma-54 dependent transcriptional regulator [Actimicrobium sp. CCI2.3]
MSSPRILVIDDEADLRELLEITLLKMGLDVDSAETLAQARACLAQHDYALVLTDMRLRDGLGIELVHEISASARPIPIAVITAFGSADNAVTALKAGAFDYLSKPIRVEQLRQVVHSALRIDEADTPAVSAAGPLLRLVGESAAMQDVRAQIVRLARSMAPVAITGESGSGKELAARDIHSQSARAGKAFVAVNCGAIPEALMEAEFFGYRKGAFTGAAEDRDGFFQAASGGTLLLDEVADLPLAMQVKLLRAIQERRVRKVGATTEEPVDVRLISATHQNLADWVEQGKFRQDLYYRLNVIELRLPPLRERRDDVGLLAGVILQRLAGTDTVTVLSPEALVALQGCTFPGNVRELENILERAMAFASDHLIEVADLALRQTVPVLVPIPVPAAEPLAESASVVAPVDEMAAEKSITEALPASLPDHLDEVERDIIRRALARTHFNRTQAAELLGISFRQLRYRMQRLDIHGPE